MIDAEWFHNKNPKASHEHCDLAATLYEVLLRKDAFEKGVQIENHCSSFRFRFPNGKIVIAEAASHSDWVLVPCYIAVKGGESVGLIFFTTDQLCSWLQNNWDYLITGDKDE